MSTISYRFESDDAVLRIDAPFTYIYLELSWKMVRFSKEICDWKSSSRIGLVGEIRQRRDSLKTVEFSSLDSFFNRGFTDDFARILKELPDGTLVSIPEKIYNHPLTEDHRLWTTSDDPVRPYSYSIKWIEEVPDFERFRWRINVKGDLPRPTAEIEGYSEAFESSFQQLRRQRTEAIDGLRQLLVEKENEKEKEKENEKEWPVDPLKTAEDVRQQIEIQERLLETLRTDCRESIHEMTMESLDQDPYADLSYYHLHNRVSRLAKASVTLSFANRTLSLDEVLERQEECSGGCPGDRFVLDRQPVPIKGYHYQRERSPKLDEDDCARPEHERGDLHMLMSNRNYRFGFFTCDCCGSQRCRCCGSFGPCEAARAAQ
jgi:hypothetical protein